MREMPACRSAVACLCRRVALVLSDRSSMRGKAASRAASSAMFLRISGSPPVMRTRVTPSRPKAPMTRSISSKFSQSSGSSKFLKPLGRQ